MSNRNRWRVSDREAEIVQGVRAGLHEQGMNVLPCDEEGKKPAFAKWPEYVYDPSDPEPMVPRTQNNAGEPTKAPHFATSVKTLGMSAVDIDIDDPMLARSARIAFEESAGVEPAFVRFRKNTGRVMLIYPMRESGGISSSNGGADGAIECDANKAGQQIMVHGRHPSGVYVEYEGDQPWEVSLDEFDALSVDALRAGLEASCGRVGIEFKNFSTDGRVAGVVERRDVSIAAQYCVDLLMGRTITPAATEIFRHLLFEYDAPPRFVEELVRALVKKGREINPQAAERYDNLLKQMDPEQQRIPLQAAMERRWMEYVEEMLSGSDYLERAIDLEKRAKAAMTSERLSSASKQLQIARVVEVVNALPEDLLPQALEYIKKKGAGK